METIFKVQCDATGTQVLVYDEHRIIFIQLPKEMAQTVIENYALLPLTKIYVKGELTPSGILMLGEVVTDPDEISW